MIRMTPTGSLLLMTIVIFQYNFIMADWSSSSNQFFPSSLLSVSNQILKRQSKSTKNIILSPLALNVTLALINLAARDFSSSQITNVLNVSFTNKTEVAIKYGKFLNELNIIDSTMKVELSPRLYASKEVGIVPSYRERAAHLGCQIETIDFYPLAGNSEKINRWIENHTGNKIRNPIENIYSGNLLLTLFANTFYFNAKWLHPFDPIKASNDSSKIKEERMTLKHYIKIGVLTSLKAKAYEFPFVNTNISMMFIVPDEHKDFGKLANKLRDINLNDISSNMNSEHGSINIPKLRIVFSMDMVDVLRTLGIYDIFTKLSKLDDMVIYNGTQRVEGITQKVYLDINEFGVEAAAITYDLELSTPRNSEYCDSRPFIFFIRSEDVVYFAGRVETC